MRYLKSKELDNQPLFTSWKFRGDYIPRLYCVAQRAYVTQESVGPTLFVSKKGMIHVRRTDVCTRKPKFWGRMYDVLPRSDKICK